MPYVITTKRPRLVAATRAKCAELVPVSCRAVATLGEAREAIGKLCHDPDRPWQLDRGWTDALVDAHHLPESGGTLGPLPDGTVIEVEPIDRAWLINRTPRKDWHQGTDQLIDAFNAREASR